MEIASVIAGEGAKSVITHVEREFWYLIHFRKNTNTLNDTVQQLIAIKSDVQTMMNAAVTNGELVKETVHEWMKRADRVLVQAKQVTEEASVINTWFKGWCCGRFTLGRKALKTFEDIQRIIEEERRIVADRIADPISSQSLAMVGIEDFNAFESRESTAQEICKALLDDEINLVGVYGMPGVGKTYLIKDIAKQVKEKQLFQEVVVVTVSQNPSLLKLQEDVAEILDLKNLGVNLSVRADRLSGRLNQDDKMTLVILDDVWEMIELSKVGIPYKNNRNCCKVVFTTRFRDVCDKMKADKKIQVSILSEEDSWTLFQQKSGNVEDYSLARDVLKECKGLPLAIVTLGLSLRGEDAIVWADALVQLRRSIFEGMSPVVFSIKLSYDFLSSKSVKICFLFCCLFPEGHEIELDVLLRYMMGEKLLENVETYDEARNRLHGIVVKLVSSGLLLRDEKGMIMMHDVVRDVAISIAAEEEGHIVKAGRNLSEWGANMELGNCKRLSMMHNSIQHFPTIPIRAPNLQALFLNNNSELTELPSDFFDGMKSLMILDLSETSIKSLPPSLSCLENLCTLLLNNTKLNNLFPISKLERLEVLSLHYFRFTNKEEIRKLSNLRVLDLTDASLHNSIRPFLFFKLRRLEELHVLDSNNPQVDEAREIELFREIGSLSRLTSLWLNVYTTKLCDINFPGPWQNLTRFNITVNPIFSNDDWNDLNYSRRLNLNKLQGKEVVNWVLVLLRRTNHLELNFCHDLESLPELANKSLKSLYLVACHSMECLVTNRIIISDPFECPNLKYVHIDGIPKIRYVFTMRVARNLLQLETLHIRDCWEMEVLFKYEDGEDILFNHDTAILPRLKELSVRDASKLKSFTNQNLVMELPSLEQLKVLECYWLKRLPFGTTSVPNLKIFGTEQVLFDSLKWENDSVKDRLQPIVKVYSPKEEYLTVLSRA